MTVGELSQFCSRIQVTLNLSSLPITFYDMELFMKNYQTVFVSALAALTIMTGCKSTTDNAAAKSAVPQRQGDKVIIKNINNLNPMPCLLYTSPSPRD